MIIMEKLVCQSCGMIMGKEDLGNNADGSCSQKYCKYCFQKGEFLKEETFEDMVESCIPFVINDYKNEIEARNSLRKQLIILKRWNNE